MRRIHDKVARFLSKDKDIKVLQKKIHYSNYSAYEDELLEFCMWASNFNDFEGIKNVLTDLPISFFCNNSKLFLNYIRQNKNTQKEESEYFEEISAINKSLYIYALIIHKYQLFTTFNQLTVVEYGEKNLDHLFGLYAYYLYQDDSPRIEEAKKEYSEQIKELPQTPILIDIYSEISSTLEDDIKKNFIKLTKKREQSKKDLASRNLYEIHRDTKTKVMMHNKRSSQLKRKNYN